MTLWWVRSQGVSSTIFTHIENVFTFTTSDVTDFAEESVLDGGFEMVSVTWTFWDWASVSSTDGTISIVIAFFASVWARWTDGHVGVKSINWTVTFWSIDSVSSTSDTGLVSRTGSTIMVTWFTFHGSSFIISVSTVTSWGVNSVNSASSTLAEGSSFALFALSATIMSNFVIKSDGSNQVISDQIIEVINSVGTVTERNLPSFHDTWEWVIPLIFTDDDTVVIRVEVSSGHSEMFVSVGKVNKETNFVISMTVSSIDEEPLSSVVVVAYVVVHIFL